MHLSHIAPTALRDYAKSLGWVAVPEYREPGLLLMSNPVNGRQLLFPLSDQAPDYAEAVERTLERIGSVYRLDFDAVLEGLLTGGEDGLEIRLAEGRVHSDEIPLEFAKDCLEAARTMVLAGATSSLTPRLVHGRLGKNTQARAVLDATNFRHTRPGSFALRLSCPLNPEGVPNPVEPDTAPPLVRQTFRTIVGTARRVVDAIERDYEERLVDEVKEEAEAGRPSLSANLCESLARLHSDRLDNSVWLAPTFSKRFPEPDGVAERPVRIQRDYFSRIQAIATEFRKTAEPREQTYVGSVERLDGEVGPDNRRFGNVVLLLRTEDEDAVRANITLDAETYAEAMRVHEDPRRFVFVRGILNAGNPRSFRDVAEFRVVG